MSDTDSYSSNSTATRAAEAQPIIALMPHTREELLEKVRISVQGVDHKSSGVKSPTRGEGFKLMAHLALLPRASQVSMTYPNIEGYSPLW